MKIRMTFTMLRFFFLILLFSLPLIQKVQATPPQYSLTELERSVSKKFPIKGSLVEKVQFWIKVYTEIKTTQAFLHDSENLSLIYKKVNLPQKRRTRHRFLKNLKRNYRHILKNIAAKGAKNLSSKEQEVYKIIGHRKISEIKEMANNLRFQYGLRDRYYKGLIRSYEYIDYIKKIFSTYHLPPELIYLPHVESSFNYNAYSKVGAAGIWQFMRSTARMYKLKVNYVVDERRDVFKATKAAARLLKDNYRRLKSWPLALTAYNHGAKSMQRAIKKLKTTEIHKIIDSYEGRRFGFASKNFYATFIATVILSQNPSRFFKEFHRPPPFKFSILSLKEPYTIKQISEELTLSPKTLGKYNPSIRKSALSSPLFLPKNFKLHIPLQKKEGLRKLQAKINQIKPTTKQYDVERLHIISRGENLYEISKAYKVSMNNLISFNQISNPSRIYAGMKLKIPGKKSHIDKVIPNINPDLPPLKNSQKKKEQAVISPSLSKEQSENSSPEIPSSLKNKATLESYNLFIKKLKTKDLYSLAVETDETLGHFADWAGIPTQKIRDWNKISQLSLIRIGQNIKLFLKKEQLQTFKQRRNEYHLSIQEDFFSHYKIVDFKTYKVRRGDTIVAILKKFELPYWLLRQEQPHYKLKEKLLFGQELKIPLIGSLEEESTTDLLE